ncbi:Glycosyl transferase, family 9 [Candidatus Magnetomorum sp. HK-1]|nr:Glycosyl transferase, family 9 [Candidatus Magnetomorum sp. HK-1]
MKNFNTQKVQKGLWLDQHIIARLKKKRKKPFACLKKILIFDFHAIGDIVLLTAFLKALRQKYVSQEIVLVAGPWANPILQNHPQLISKLIVIKAPWVVYDYSFKSLYQLIKLIRKLRLFEFDMGIEIRGDLRQIFLMKCANVKQTLGYTFTGGKQWLTNTIPDDGQTKHLLDYHQQICNYLKCDTSCFQPQLFLSEKEKQSIKSLKANRAPKTTLGIHPGARKSLKQIEGSKLADVINHFYKQQWHIILFQGPTDKALIKNIKKQIDCPVEIVNVPMRAYILQIASCDHIVCMDSGVGHIAAALKIPVTVIFGPTLTKFCKPIGEKISIVQIADVPCRPCGSQKCNHKINHFCMSQISSETIISMLEHHHESRQSKKDPSKLSRVGLKPIAVRLT